MASSDDEADTLPESVSTYHFADDKDEPISFSLLPIRWSESKNFDDGKKNHMIFLKGSVDNGLRTIYKQVIAWKFDLSNTTPQISVLTKEKCWMELGKPRKSYEIIIRTVLITVHCLHFARRNPEASGKSVWDYLSKTFSLYEHRPSQNDLVDHLDLIGEAVRRENSLAKCKFLLNFLGEKPRKKMLCDEDFQAATMSAFIVDDVEDDNFEDLEEDESNDEDELFDSVCAFCDNGGNLLCCEGSCLRSFHATVEAGEESACESLGFTNREVEAMQSFFCKNCKFKQHQCFACGKLGSSDKFSGAEVFRCANATCGHFYHPHCAATMLHREDKVAAEELRKKIAVGESFACPIHKCCICKQVEDKKKSDLQFAVCRRCPTSYHQKCLPKEIVFENEADEDTIARAWQNLLPNRILIYCLKHDIIEDIGTPVRDHIRFPDVGEKNTAAKAQKRKTSELPANEEESLSNKKRLTSEESFSGTFRTKASKEMSSSAKIVKITNDSEQISSESNSLGKMRMNNPSRKSSRDNTKSASSEVERSTTANVNKTSLGDKLYAFMTNKSGKAKLGKQDIFGSELDDKSLAVKSVAKKLTSELPSLDADTQRRLLALVKEAASSITLDNVIKKHEVPSTHVHSSKNVVDKNITLGKVEGTVEAVRTALKKLEEKCSIEDAKAVCELDVLNQVFKWKNKLKVYLAPFLYGMRYTSFGRHFTKVEKLTEIADILRWYVENGDMIVDFCCGANDFSCIMKKKLEEMGKKCSYKNYDVIQPKNDFNFEKRDWMTVCPDELPKKGSQLIMGLNPPFGVKQSIHLLRGQHSPSMDLQVLFTDVPLVTAVICTVSAMLLGLLGYLYGPYWGVRKVPGPPVIPLLGHLPLMAKHGPDVFTVLAKRYGPIFRFHMGRQPLIIVADPELCKEVAIKKFKDIPNRSVPSPISASPLHQKGLFFTRDARWSTMRNTILSVYQPSHLASLVPTMQSFIESATENFQCSNEEITFSNFSLKLATDVIGQAAFGVDFGLSKPQSASDPINSFHSQGKDNCDVSEFINQHIYSTTQLKMDLSGSFSIIIGLLVPILQEPFRQILKRIPGTMDWKVDRTNRNISGRLDEIVRKKMEEKNRGSKDFLSLILRSRESETLSKKVFTPDYISAVTYEHLLAGSITTSFTLSSIVYLVAQHPETEKKLLAEIDGFGPHDQIPTAHDLQNKFPYLDQVVKEAMRFYVVSPLVARETSKEVEIGGYVLPKGTWIWLAPGVLAKDPKNFPEPDRFKPERFDPNCEEEKRRHPCALIPFGIGPRACIGKKFSIQEIKLSLIHLYRKYLFRHSPNMEKPLEFEFGIVLNFKRGVKLRIIKRT